MMTIRACASAALLASCVASFAYAASYDDQLLSASIPYWYEAHAGVQEDGVAVWTARSPEGAPVATVSRWDEGSLTLPLIAPVAPETMYGSYAMDVSSGGAIVGYVAANPRETVRRATAWMRSGASYVPSATLQNAVPAMYAQAAAYAVYEGPSSELYTAGYVRERPGASTLARPVVWNTSTNGMSTLRYLTADNAPGYGIAYGVTEDWACGAAGASAGAYAYAACWPLDAVAGTRWIDEVGSTAGYATSVVNRVRRINTGSDAAPQWQSIAVGHATTTTGSVTAFAYNLTTDEFLFDVALDPRAESMAFDVAATPYPAP